jgi:CRISPR-associated protein Csd2
MDNRWFGAVASTDGPLKGSFYGQIRGPLQFAFAESLDRVLQLDATITRCAVASEKEKPDGSESEETGNRTMGRKHVVNYGLYRTHIYFSPAFAAKTGFTYYDLDNFFFALVNMFRDDTAAGRAGMRVVGLVDFQHSSALGNEHSHRLFDRVRVERTAEGAAQDFPNSLNDYCGEAPCGPVVVAPNNGSPNPLVVSKRLVWEIPECKLTKT